MESTPTSRRRKVMTGIVCEVNGEVRSSGHMETRRRKSGKEKLIGGVVM